MSFPKPVSDHTTCLVRLGGLTSFGGSLVAFGLKFYRRSDCGLVRSSLKNDLKLDVGQPNSSK